MAGPAIRGIPFQDPIDQLLHPGRGRCGLPVLRVVRPGKYPERKNTVRSCCHQARASHASTQTILRRKNALRSALEPELARLLAEGTWRNLFRAPLRPRASHLASRSFTAAASCCHTGIEPNRLATA